ncbi:thymidylate synthase [Priestia megaterium]|uniref:thymidylate synthase n=1 Tax=Priestia megaterium TaxID=1404 RepID=UPI002FFF892B
MSNYDLVYIDVVQEIFKNGEWDYDTPVRTKWADETPAYAKSVLNVKMKFDNAKEALMLTQKRVPKKDPIIELFWIWIYKSNNVRKLQEMGCHVWDEWMRSDETIGKAYGWQLGNKRRKVEVTEVLLEMLRTGFLKGINIEFTNDGYAYLDQVDYLLYSLKTNPFSRRIKTTLWCVEDLDDMSLPPCVYETHWEMHGGRLCLTVKVRSNDMGLGNPYNVFQYSVLHRMVAQVTGLEVGTICFNIDNAHIYDRHIDKLFDQIQRPIHDAPDLWINPEITSLYDFTIDDIKVTNYNNEGSIPMEVAI